MNPIDLVAVLLLVLSTLLGFRSGAFPQVGGLLGAVAGGALAIIALPNLAEPLAGVDPGVRPLVVLGGLLACVALGESVGSGIGRRLAGSLGSGVLSAADRLAGAILGAAQAVLIVWLAGGLLAIGPVPRLTEAAQTSVVVRALNGVLPPPSLVAADLGELLDATGLPQVFLGFEPLPRPPVERPTDARARAIAAVGESSTLRVAAQTCGLSSSGSGVVVAGEYVVTNAHVVAGAGGRAVQVVTAQGARSDAVVVLFDPSFDVAVLYARGLHGRALRFASTDPVRGALGASLGFPGGGALTIVPAAVTGAYPAVGRDIYGQRTIRRQILELRAEIERGDSGGPFMLADGTIGGLVFAEARTDESVGYALTPTEVAVHVAPALGRTTAVGTGSCLR